LGITGFKDLVHYLSPLSEAASHSPSQTISQHFKESGKPFSCPEELSIDPYLDPD
jgi:hypothetical protein